MARNLPPCQGEKLILKLTASQSFKRIVEDNVPICKNNYVLFWGQVGIRKYKRVCKCYPFLQIYNLRTKDNFIRIPQATCQAIPRITQFPYRDIFSFGIFRACNNSSQFLISHAPPKARSGPPLDLSLGTYSEVHLMFILCFVHPKYTRNTQRISVEIHKMTAPFSNGPLLCIQRILKYAIVYSTDLLCIFVCVSRF